MHSCINWSAFLFSNDRPSDHVREAACVSDFRTLSWPLDRSHDFRIVDQARLSQSGTDSTLKLQSSGSHRGASKDRTAGRPCPRGVGRGIRARVGNYLDSIAQLCCDLRIVYRRIIDDTRYCSPGSGSLLTRSPTLSSGGANRPAIVPRDNLFGADE